MRFAPLLATATLAFAGGYTTSIGDIYPFVVSAMTTDAAGNTYVVGSRELGGGSPTMIVSVLGTTPPVVTSPYFYYNGSDVFVTKLDPDGNILFTDTFAGKGVDTGTAITVDASGNIYIAGSTTSPDFPLSKPLQTQSNTTDGTGFIMKLSGDGSTILYSTYFGGTLGPTSISALATDSKGNLYLTGTTTASDFPHTPGMPFGQIQAQPALTISGAIIASISAAGDKILYSGALVGTIPGPPDCVSSSGGSFCVIKTAGAGIAVDAAGNAYLAGNSGAVNLPSTAGVLASYGAGAFVAKFNASGSGLTYLTYLESGPTGASTATSIAVDATGDAYLGGYTSDLNFPTTAGAYQPTLMGSSTKTDGFVVKLNPAATAFLWATYLGGGDSGTNGVVQSISISSNDAVWATGLASSSTVPNVEGWSTGPEFLAGLTSTGSQLGYSARYPAGTIAQSVALDSTGLVHIAGSSGFISALPATVPPVTEIFDFQNAAAGSITARISPAEVISIYGPAIGPVTPVTAVPSNGFYPTTLGGVKVTVNGVSIPLLYVSAGQINAVVPMEVKPNAAALVRATNGGSASSNYSVWIVPSAPGAFGPVLNSDGTVNSQSHPAKGGSAVTFYATGWQANFAPLTDGQVAVSAQDACLGTCQISPTNNVSNLQFTVLYGGSAPGIVAGVTQFNVKVPAIPSSYGTFQYSFLLTGLAGVSQSMWVTP